MTGRESVRARRTLERMVEGGSVRRMRDVGLGWDLDILRVGSWRDIMRLAGAVWEERKEGNV